MVSSLKPGLRLPKLKTPLCQWIWKLMSRRFCPSCHALRDNTGWSKSSRWSKDCINDQPRILNTIPTLGRSKRPFKACQPVLQTFVDHTSFPDRMCIVLLSNTHPDYSLILLSNRDEFLDRPTKTADWWDAPNQDILGGRDLLRLERGTWLALHRDGRLAVLTNFREEGIVRPEARSRGSLIPEYLSQNHRDETRSEDFLRSLGESGGLTGIGGFSLIYGRVGQPLAVISNRTTDPQDIVTILQTQETIGLSNALITNRSWTKVTEGEELLESAIKENVKSKTSREGFIESLFRILSRDTLPKTADGAGWEGQVRELRKSIFIPAVGGTATEQKAGDEIAAAKPNDHVSLEAVDTSGAHVYTEDGAYGTQKQTVILVTHAGHVKLVERTLVDDKGVPFNSQSRDVTFEFDIHNSG